MKQELHRCHDCDAEEGELHSIGCDMERCPFCGGQLISCECAYKLLKVDASPGTWAYKHGLTEDQERAWLALLFEKGRIPYLSIPNICAMCGALWPEMFMVSDEDWKKYIPRKLQGAMLCYVCYHRLAQKYEEKGRKVTIREFPVFCCLCGQADIKQPEISKEEKEMFILPELQKAIICVGCYEDMMSLWPKGWKAVSRA
jgi:hypothetical protein